MKHKSRYFWILAIVLVLHACKDNTNAKILAQVYDYKLYASDIPHIYPANCSANDSALCLQNYINNWVNTMVVLQKAEKNLNEKQKDFTNQLQEYKNSLTIHAYEDLLIRQMQSEPISEKELQDYYEAHKDNFLLKSNIVKVLYVKVDKNSPQLPKFKQALFGSYNEKVFFDLCGKYAVNYFVDDVWLQFDDLLKEIPIQTYNYEVFLKNNRQITVSDDLYTYFALIKDFKIKESVSPFSFEKEKIKNILLMQKKIKLIQTMNVDLRKTAETEGKIKIYATPVKPVQ